MEVVKPIEQTSHSKAIPVLLIAAIVIVVLGLGTGYLATRGGSVSSIGNKQVIQQTGGEVKKGQTYGSTDEKAFRDGAEGTLEKGGLDGEGSHKLIRPGGESQTAYLTSSTLNLDEFVGKKIKVWGETYEAQKAGWFMDVGRVEILE